MAFRKLTAAERKKLRQGTDPIQIAEKMKVDEQSQLHQKRLAWVCRRLIAGKSIDGVASRLGPNAQRLVKRIKRTLDLARRAEIFSEFAAEDQKLAELFAATSPNEPDPDRIATGEDLLRELANIKWLWRGWIARGMVSILLAPPGLGKSAFALGAIALCVMEGTNWPCGLRGPQKGGKVLWIDTECTQGLTRYRIKTWKLVARLILLPGPDVTATIRLDEESNIEALRELIRIHKPDLVVIDSLRGCHNLDENNSNVANILQPLAAVARDSGASILVIHHTRKLGEGKETVAEDARGSNAQIALARTVLALDKPDADSSWIRIRVVKSNVGLPPEPIGFRISDRGLEFGPAPERPRKERAEAKANATEFLRAFLSGGPKSAKEVEKAAKKAGISKATLRRASSDMKIKKPAGGKSMWSLPKRELAQKTRQKKQDKLSKLSKLSKFTFKAQG